MTHSTLDCPALAEFTFFRGRVGLSAILRALGIGKGDSVAIQAFTCVAVPEGIMAAGATPRYVDIERGGVNMDPDDLRTRIDGTTKAIVVQHTFGIPADLERILKVAQGRNLVVIEDCCHTIQSRYRERAVGSFGVAAFYSFEWGKPLVAGLGGSVLCNDTKLLESLKDHYKMYVWPDTLSNVKIMLQYIGFSLAYRPKLYWQIKRLYHFLAKMHLIEGSYHAAQDGFETVPDFRKRMVRKCRSRLIARLSGLEEVTKHSRLIASEYERLLSSRFLRAPLVPEGSDVVYARYPLIAANKHEIVASAEKAGIEIASWYATPVHPLKGEDLALVKYILGSCARAEAMAERIISLPTNEKTGAKSAHRVIRFLNPQGIARP